MATIACYENMIIFHSPISVADTSSTFQISTVTALGTVHNLYTPTQYMYTHSQLTLTTCTEVQQANLLDKPLLVPIQAY